MLVQPRIHRDPAFYRVTAIEAFNVGRGPTASELGNGQVDSRQDKSKLRQAKKWLDPFDPCGDQLSILSLGCPVAPRGSDRPGLPLEKPSDLRLPILTYGKGCENGLNLWRHIDFQWNLFCEAPLRHLLKEHMILAVGGGADSTIRFAQRRNQG